MEVRSMSARVEAAAKVIGSKSIYRPRDLAAEALDAADSIMFSESAIERAALRLWNAKHPSDPPLSDLSELMEWTRESYLWQARAVVAALREEA